MITKNHITTAILGAKGSGKSVLLASMVNECTEKCILFDMLGVFNPEASNKTAIVPDSYYCINVDAFFDHITEFPGNSKIIIDFSAYVGEDLIMAVDRVARALMERRERIAVFSDEVADFMQEGHNLSYEFWRLVKNGRNFGIRPVVFATQRPQDVSKKIFDLCDTFLISKQKAKGTIEYILKLLNMDGSKQSRARILSLKPRQFLIFSGDKTETYNVPEYAYAFEQ